MSDSSEAKITIVTALYALTMLVSLVGNCCLIYIVWKVYETRSLTSFMFVNMAVADLLVTFIMMPMNINEMHNDFGWLVSGTFGDISCRTVQYITKITIMASILSLTFMAIDRFYVIKFPLVSRVAWFRKSKFVSPFIWLLSMALMSIMPVVYFLNENGPSCELNPLGNAKVTIRGLFIYLFLVSYLIPLAIISTLYGKTAHAIWFRSTPGNRLTGTQQRMEEINKKRVVRMLVIIVAVFAVCWLPAQLMHLFFAATLFRVSLPYFVPNLAFWLGHANSAINPWLYICLSSKMKPAFLQILGRRHRARKDDIYSSRIKTTYTDVTKEENIPLDCA